MATWARWEPDSLSELDIAALYREQAAFLARCIVRLVGDGPHVDDLLQEAFVVAHRKRDRYDPDRAAPTTWLYGIAANLCRHHRRSRSRRAALQARLLTESVGADGPRPPDHELERQERADLVHALIGRLKFKQREVFTLYELEGLPGEDIAALLGIPVNTVWTRLHHARKAFARLAAKRGLEVAP